VRCLARLLKRVFGWCAGGQIAGVRSADEPAV